MADLTWTVGTPAVVTDDMGTRWRTALRGEPWSAGGGYQLVQIEGIAGRYLCGRIKLGDDPSLPHFRERVRLRAQAHEIQQAAHLLWQLQQRHPGCPVELCYHPDADPGDGGGWSLMIGDRTNHGALVGLLNDAMGVLGGT